MPIDTYQSEVTCIAIYGLGNGEFQEPVKMKCLMIACEHSADVCDEHFLTIEWLKTRRELTQKEGWHWHTLKLH